MSGSPKSRKSIESRLVVKAWKDAEFKKKLIADPKAAIASELGVDAAKALGKIEIQAIEETPTKLYFIIPANPLADGDKLGDSELEDVAGGGGAKAFTQFKCVTYPASLGGNCAG